MFDDFGQISVDSLPEDYGSAPSRVIQRVYENPVQAQPLPSLEIPENVGPLPVLTAQEGYFPEAPEGEFAGDGDEEEVDLVEVDYDGLLNTLSRYAPRQTRDQQAFWARARRNSVSTDSEILISTETGYTYRRYSDGRIEILATPTGKGVNKIYSADSTAARNVEAEFGPYERSSASSKKKTKKSKAKSGAGLEAFAAIASAVVSAMGPQTSTVYDETAISTTEDSSSSGPPWGLIIGGVAAVVVIGGVVYAISRSDKSE